MSFSILILAASLLGQPAVAETTVGTLSCKAIYRTLDENRREIQTIADMPVAFSDGGVIKYQTDHEGMFFSITEQKDLSLLAQIIAAPDYRSGPVSRGDVDSNGKFNLALVNDTTVHKIECQKLPAVTPPRLGL